MDIGREIKQNKPFISEKMKAIINLMFTGSYVIEQANLRLKPYKLNDQHYNILRILRGSGATPLSPGELKKRLINKRGDLTRLVDKLVKRSLVNRCTNPECRRLVDITITEKGLALLKELDVDTEGEVALAKKLSEEEAKQLNALLDKIRT